MAYPPVAVVPVVVEKYPDRTLDLLYAIFKKLGGMDIEIEEKYFDRGDDLLYAILKKIQGGVSGGNGNFATGMWKIDLDFDGTAGKGAIGNVTLPASALQAIPAGTVIYEVVVAVSTTEPLVADPASYLTLGIEDEVEDCGLDENTGLVELLNNPPINKVITPNFIKSLATQVFKVAVNGAPITDGKCCIIFQTLNFTPSPSTGG